MEIDTLDRVLSQHPFFQSLDEGYRKLIVGCASNVVFQAGEIIFREGESADQFYIIRHGRVALEMHNGGKGPIIVETLGEGDVLGWSWLVPPYHWRFDAHAVELTRAIALDGQCLRKKCYEDHSLGYELLMRIVNLIAERLHATRMQLMDVYGNVKH